MSERRDVLPRFTDRLPLGQSGLLVSPLCIGAVDDPDTIPHAFDAGINTFFVSADMHWPMYEATRNGLERLLERGGGVRDDVVVVGCTYVSTPKFAYTPFFEMLDAIRGLGRIDVLVAGGVYDADALPRCWRTRDQVTQGFMSARGAGASFHDRRAARALLESGVVDLAFVRFNAWHPGAIRDLFPFVPPHPRKALLFNFKSTHGWVREDEATKAGVEEDVWLPSLTDQYRFVLSRRAVDGTLCSPLTPKEVDGIAAALAQGPLDETDEMHLVALNQRVRGANKASRPRP